MNVITTDTINVRCGCTGKQDQLPMPGSRDCALTPSSSHIFCCSGIWIMSRCIDTHIHGWAADNAAFQQRLSCPGYFQTLQPTLLSTDLPLLPGVSEHSQLINTTDDDDLIKDRLWRKSQRWIRKSQKGKNGADHKSADLGSVVLHFAKPPFFIFQSKLLAVFTRS